MSERYPIGTTVTVANGGRGHSVRKDHETVGAFVGTVVETSGPGYSGIPEVCVESATGERRVILVGDLEEAPVSAEESSTGTDARVDEAREILNSGADGTVGLSPREAMVIVVALAERAGVGVGDETSDGSGWARDLSEEANSVLDRFLARLIAAK